MLDFLFGKSNVENISAREVESRLKKEDVLLLDVRTRREYKEGHIPNSLNIPLAELKGNLNRIDKDKDIIAICASGARSKRATQELMSAGYDKVKNMSGGMISWQGKVE
ncbi:rhodanese-like domain-containing protein [Halonatronum saccharophilum]|uniref:rhodanese-like domain-containing protein n=1 Tax=Halonatronum saccharophilum TaxID=150060 RepID=UPI0004AF6A37|nr:rhodanese-like domain-containing protein [Halonatronum saccharophilum]